MKNTILTIAFSIAMALPFAEAPAKADPLYELRFDTNLWENSFARGNVRCNAKEGDRINRDWGQNWSRWIYGRLSQYDRSSMEYTDSGCHGWFDKTGHDESDVRIVPYLEHDSVSPAHTAGADDRILDQCDGLDLTCTKNVWVTIRPELLNGQHTHLPYDVEVRLLVTRWGPFFPNQTGVASVLDRKVTIPAGKPGELPSATFKVPLALDSTPEYGAGYARYYPGVGKVSMRGDLFVRIESLRLLGKDRHYSKGAKKSNKTLNYAIYDKAVENMPEFKLAAQNSTVAEGNPVIFELRGNKNPNFKMRVRVDYAFPNGDRFFDLDSRYRHILLEPNSGVDIGNGEYRFATFQVDTILDLAETADGAITASIGDKKSGWHWNDQSWGLKPSERTGVTVAVNNSVKSDISGIISDASSVVEGSTVQFQLASEQAPETDFRIRVDFAYTGDFFGSNPPTHTHVNIGPNLGSVDANGIYRSDGFDISTLLEVADESNGSITATIGEKRLGHSDTGLLIPLTAEESAISSTVVVEDSVIPEFRITSTGTRTFVRDNTETTYVGEGLPINYALQSDVRPNVNLRIRVDFAYVGDFFEANPPATVTFSAGPDHGVLNTGGYTSPQFVLRTVDDERDEPEGSVTATIGQKQLGAAEDGQDVPLTANERAESLVVTVFGADRNYFFLQTLKPTINAGDIALWRIMSYSQTSFATRVTIRYADNGHSSLFGADSSTIETYSIAADSGSEIEVGYGHFTLQSFGRTTYNSSESGSIDAAITSITETIPQYDGTTTTRTITIPEEHQILVRIAINGQALTQSRSLGAMHAYREASGSHESDVVDEGTESTQEQISLAFNRPSTMNVQSFVETVGTSINSGANLSELTKMPSFSMPLTSGTEVTGPLTMWVDSNDSDTLAVGHIGMDLSMHDSHVLGVTASSLKSELSEDISEDMNMVQSYLAYKPVDSDVHVSAIVGLGAGDLSMEEFDNFKTSRMLAQVGIHGDIASYGNESIDGNLKLDATAGISEHTVLDTDQYYGWTSIGRNASVLATSDHTVKTTVGTFNPTIWAGFENQLEAGGGFTFDDLKPYGLNLSAWINGKSPDSANDFTADVKYGFANADSPIITPSLELTVNDGISHSLGVEFASGNYNFGGNLTNRSKYGFNGTIRW